ncbi:MAG: HAD family phosphatase [Candidatus Solibacter usitatus]|nr:HAD family phosphatase [Candidatus Solibacter usitatus]
MIRTVIFDLGRVIVPFDFMRGYRAMSEICGLSPDEIRGRLSASGLVVELEAGRIDEVEFNTHAQEVLGTSMPREQFEAIWFSVFLPYTLIPESLVAGLRRNYRTVLLSNTNPVHFRGIRANYPILDHFDAFVLSHEVGAMKPSPEIYQAAILAAQCKPAECFFTDDVAEYVEGARRAGMDAVLFEDAGQVERELRARGVHWD